LLSGRDPLTFFVDKIIKFCGCRQQLRHRVSLDHLQQQDQICAYTSKKIVKIDIDVHSQRYMEQRYEAVDANQATAVKKILRGLRDSIELKQ
jgi:hypothetical protein